MNMECPYCRGAGTVNHRPAPVALTRLQRRIYELLAGVPAGLPIEAVLDRVYLGDRPPSARNSVWVTILNANKRLEPFHQRIVARGGWCVLKINGPVVGAIAHDANRGHG